MHHLQALELDCRSCEGLQVRLDRLVCDGQLQQAMSDVNASVFLGQNASRNKLVDLSSDSFTIQGGGRSY